MSIEVDAATGTGEWSSGRMAGVPESSDRGEHADQSPVVALAWSQQLRHLLEAHHREGAKGYSAQRDAEYRRLRRRLLDLIRRTTFLRELAESMHVFPPALSDKCDDFDKTMWDLGGRQEVVKFEGRVLTALEGAGSDVFAADAITPAVSGLPPTAAPAPATPPAERPNRAQRRAERRREQALSLRSQGKTIKEIARALGCSERTVFAYLQDLN